MKTFLRIAVVSLALVAFSTSAVAKDLSVTRGFRTCVDIGSVGLVSTLLALEPNSDPKLSEQYYKAYAGRVAPGSLGFKRLQMVDSEDYARETRVSLTGRDKLLGLPIKAASAITCEDACGFALWALDLGRLAPADKKRVRSWVKTAPSTILDTNPDTPIRVQYEEKPDGQIFLLCDLST